jgi:hypothetical protein
MRSEETSAKQTIFFSLSLILLASFYIIGSSYVGLNGNHLQRQSDAYSQILGFLGEKHIRPFSNFSGETTIYDIPIYQFLVAKISSIAIADPLVAVKYINFVFFSLLSFSGYKLAEHLNKGSGFIYLFLITTSPLLLHYYSTPLPDVMAISLSLAGVTLLIKEVNWVSLTISSILLFVSALIKSPVPFVFIVFYASYLLLNYNIRENY